MSQGMLLTWLRMRLIAVYFLPGPHALETIGGGEGYKDGNVPALVSDHKGHVFVSLAEVNSHTNPFIEAHHYQQRTPVKFHEHFKKEKLEDLFSSLIFRCVRGSCAR